ncbi:MAG: DUF4268 domain-containing protein [Chloroflexi bacterium]|nr:DUF4268 domain-containing protein [Chloroflexota bacterium]
MIGKLQRVPLREVWQHEAQGFTKWLEENCDVLNEILDLTLTNVERERSAGSFSVDLVAEDASGGVVVIENQLERSDHEHLGKLLTYLTALEAKAGIWIVADPRPEHVRAITWLNESASASFYLVKAEAVRIGESPPAALLTLIVGPSEEGRQVGDKKEELAERYVLRQRFWTALLDRARKQTKLHANISPGRENWLGTGAGISGLGYNYVIGQHEARVELYIDRGRDSGDQSKVIFDAIEGAKGEIEAAYGSSLVWERLEGKRACRISDVLQDGGYRDEERWPQIQDAMIDAMIRLEKALGPHIRRLKV